MDLMISMEMIAGVCGVVLCILLLKRKVPILLSFLFRMCAGIVEILLFNNILANGGISVSVGINFISLLTTGSLGFAGVVALFAIVATKFL